MTEEWISLKDYDGEDNSIILVPCIATEEPEDIEVKCPCPKCSNEFISSKIMVPVPNMLAKNNDDSREFGQEEVYTCEKCGSEIAVTVDNSKGGMDIEIESVARNDISFRHYPRPIEDETG